MRIVDKMKYENKVIHGDCLKILNQLPENSIDCVFTDPPYIQENLWLYQAFAKRVREPLKQGKYVFSYVGIEYLPETLTMLTKYLDYFFTYFIELWGALLPQKKITNNIRPIIVLTNGKPKKLHPIGKTLFKAEERNKVHHKWEQGTRVPKHILRRYTEKGDIILDPFTGSGSFLVAAKSIGRDYIGIEKEKRSCQIARARVKKATQQKRLA